MSVNVRIEKSMVLYRSFRRGRPHHEKENVWLSRKIVEAWPRRVEPQTFAIYAHLIAMQKDMRLKANAYRCLARPSMEKAVSQWGIDQAGFPPLCRGKNGGYISFLRYSRACRNN